MTLVQPFPHVANDNATAKTRAPRLRFAPIVALADGADAGADVQFDAAFEDQRQFGFSDAGERSSAKWLGDLVEAAGRKAALSGLEPRPLAIVAPGAALADPDGPMAAEAGARRANICPQEVRLEFPDASLVALEELGADRLEAYANRGFRIGLDARFGWRTPFGSMLRVMVEAVRLDTRRLDPADVPETRLDAACADGVMLVAENAAWRDGDRLRGLGVNYAVAPKADA